MNITQRKKGTVRTVQVSGSLTVSDSRELREAILSNLGKGHQLRLGFGDVSDVDLSFVQVLAAASAAGKKKDRTFSITGPVPEPVVSALRFSGLLDHGSCPDPECVWCSINGLINGESGA